MKVEAVKDTNKITLHSKGLKIDTKAITITGGVECDDSNFTIANTQFDKKNELFHIRTEDQLTAKGKYAIFIPFESTLGNGMYGYYKTSYYEDIDKGKNNRKKR